jgi:hypothetical protein
MASDINFTLIVQYTWKTVQGREKVHNIYLNILLFNFCSSFCSFSVVSVPILTLLFILEAVVCVNNSNTTGPLLRVREGDWVRVTLCNRLFLEGSIVTKREASLLVACDRVSLF